MNTPSALRRAFAAADMYVSLGASEPAYHFENPLMYRMIKWMNKQRACGASAYFVRLCA